MPVLQAYRDRVAQGALQPDAAQEAAAARLSHLAQSLQTWSPGWSSWLGAGRGPGLDGIYLFGDVGRGKSMLMDIFVDAMADARVRRVHFLALLRDGQDLMADARRAHADDPIAFAAKAVAASAHVLCFDEVQVTDIGDAMILGRLFEGLFGRGVTMVATSNRPPRDLYKNGINRGLFEPFIDQMEARMEVIELAAARDYRLERLEGAPVWHAPMGPAQLERFDAAWARLIEGDEEACEVLHVRGRKVRVARAAAGAARMRFEDLCGQALGAEDYGALTERFHTLALEAVPKLTPANRNEAKRFVTLVDTLYETRTKLIALAEAEPGALYVQGDGAFEFQRTVSRLMEMRSRVYLAAPRTVGETLGGGVAGGPDTQQDHEQRN